MKEREMISPFGDGIVMFPADAEVFTDGEKAAIDFLRERGVSLILNFDISANHLCSIEPKTNKVGFFDNNFNLYVDKVESWNRDEEETE